MVACFYSIWLQTRDGNGRSFSTVNLIMGAILVINWAEERDPNNVNIHIFRCLEQSTAFLSTWFNAEYAIYIGKSPHGTTFHCIHMIPRAIWKLHPLQVIRYHIALYWQGFASNKELAKATDHTECHSEFIWMSWEHQKVLRKHVEYYWIIARLKTNTFLMFKWGRI